jgi:hypothetical protein
VPARQRDADCFDFGQKPLAPVLIAAKAKFDFSGVKTAMP